MNEFFVKRVSDQLDEIRAAGLFKKERVISSEQGAEIIVNGHKVLNFCANNYLGLSSHPQVIQAAHKVLDERGYGLSSVRFICGTQDIHKELEEKLSEFLGTEDTILYVAAFDANGGVFEPLLVKRMPLYLMNSITRPSLTASDCARRGACGINIMIWPTWNHN